MYTLKLADLEPLCNVTQDFKSGKDASNATDSFLPVSEAV